ncbi:hypothetical protein SAMN05444920_14422 [Nonomuraea solani]|uniref:Uncharacterized protein n=1 Tax=Nonomuraea solani TaxID=1144553 RepID=A0A1H6F2G7_9ACTN|nr:hypothetical protein SAMN05444920_14422 [Nonomuraea solani]
MSIFGDDATPALPASFALDAGRLLKRWAG